MTALSRSLGNTIPRLLGFERGHVRRLRSTAMAHRTPSYAGKLYKQASCNELESASEQDFFEYTAKRWLFNESWELSRRHVKFDIQGLFDTTVATVGKGATECVRAIKLPEGQFNKAFALTLDNGIEVVAKIPNPNAGPSHLTTASEAATMDWVRNVLKVPAPAILAWNSNPSNLVGAEYIIMEKAKGVLLSDIWYGLQRYDKNKIVNQIVTLQGVLASQEISAHGCLYYRENVALGLSCSPEAGGDLDPRYAIGPLVSPALWNDGRDELSVHKGPWTTLSAYATDLGRNERAWVEKHAIPRMNYFHDCEKPEQPTEMLDLLEKYLKVAPYISESSKDISDLTKPVMSHPDLHLSNIFVDPDTKVITNIIDWQGAAFAPLITQAKVPRMVRHLEPLKPGLFMPEKPSNYEEMDESARRAADSLHESAVYHKYYETLLANKQPRLYAALAHRASFSIPLTEPFPLVCEAWKNRKAHSLRSSLMLIAERWDDLGTSLSSCPISFSADSIQRHEEELANIDNIEAMVEAFQEEGVLPADGRVDHQDYEAGKEINRLKKEQYLSLAADADEAVVMDKIWPWQDWPERAAAETLT